MRRRIYFRPIINYRPIKNEIEDLFVYTAALVISDGVNARIGSLTASEEWFMFWRAIKDETDRPILEYELETLIKGFFHKELFLDYLQNFIMYEEEVVDLWATEAHFALC